MQVEQVEREVLRHRARTASAAAPRRWRGRCRAQPMPEVDAAGVQRLEHGELLGDDERRVVRQHHAAASRRGCGACEQQMRDAAPTALVLATVPHVVVLARPRSARPERVGAGRAWWCSAERSALVFPSLTMARSSADSLKRAAPGHAYIRPRWMPPWSPARSVAVAGAAFGRSDAATALHLASGATSCYGTVRDKAKAAKLLAMAEERGVEVLLVELEVTDDESVRRGMAEVLGRAGHVDVLGEQRGRRGHRRRRGHRPATYLELMNINLCGAVRCIQAVLPSMRERRRGAIVNVTSIAGSDRRARAIALRHLEVGVRGPRARGWPRSWHRSASAS